MCCVFLLLVISLGFVWIIMEILGEFFVTAFVAVIFSFLIAKLVSMAMSGDSGAESESKSGIDVGVETKTRELRSGERLEVKAFESERKVELVEEIVGEADEIEAAPGEVEEIAELDDRCGEFEAELRRLREETEAGVRFDGVVGEESFGGGKGDELDQESASEVEELEYERAQVDEIVESAALSPEMEAIHCEQPENFESEVKFEDITEEKLEKKDAEEMVPEKSKSEMNSDDIVEEKVVNKDVEEIDEALETKKDYEAQSDEIGVVDESKLESDNDDDDWEGIERSELEEDFAVAAKYVESKGELQGVVGSDVQMEMYGLHKVATEGPCREPQPMALKMNARAKWNAWQRLGNMSPEVAMEQYVALLSDRVPGWMEDNSAGESKQEHAEAGFQAAVIPATSSLPGYQTNSTQQRNAESESAVAGDHKSECTTSNNQGNE